RCDDGPARGRAGRGERTGSRRARRAGLRSSVMQQLARWTRCRLALAARLDDLGATLAGHLHGLQDVVDEDDAVISLELHASGGGDGGDDGIDLVVVDDDLQPRLLEQIHLLLDATIALLHRRGVRAATEGARYRHVVDPDRGQRPAHLFEALRLDQSQDHLHRSLSVRTSPGWHPTRWPPSAPQDGSTLEFVRHSAGNQRVTGFSTRIERRSRGVPPAPRSAQVLSSIAKRHSNQTVVVVTHGGFW